MDQSAFIMFFAIVMTVYTIVNVYILYRLRQGLVHGGRPGIYIFRIFLVWALVFPVARISAGFMVSESSSSGMLYEAVSLIIIPGSMYLAFMLYAFIVFLLIDILRLLTRIPGLSSKKYVPGHFAGSIAALLTGLFLVVPGCFSAVYPGAVYYEIILSGSDKGKPLRAVVLSDLHLGYQIGNRQLTRMVDRINAEKPDIILMPGDIIDHDVGILIHRNMAEVLRGFSAGYGVYASPGNHEYYGGIERSLAFLESAGIRLLADEAINLDGRLILAGRHDPAALDFKIPRAELADILRGSDPSIPVIVLDHQPIAVEEAVRNGVDILISGHTHNGQLFPFNYITSAIFKISRGYVRKGNTHIVVTSGIGTWGPRVRVGSRSELVVLDIYL